MHIFVYMYIYTRGIIIQKLQLRRTVTHLAIKHSVWRNAQIFIMPRWLVNASKVWVDRDFALPQFSDKVACWHRHRGRLAQSGASSAQSATVSASRSAIVVFVTGLHCKDLSFALDGFLQPFRHAQRESVGVHLQPGGRSVSKFSQGFSIRSLPLEARTPAACPSPPPNLEGERPGTGIRWRKGLQSTLL